jgi:hypothetical protein
MTPPGVLPPTFPTLAWLCSQLALSVIVTATIMTIVWPSRSVVRAGGGRRASSVIGIIAESAAVYTTVSVLYVVSVATNSVYRVLFLQLFGIAAVRGVVLPLSLHLPSD